jgi:hypothetical protein
LEEDIAGLEPADVTAESCTIITADGALFDLAVVEGDVALLPLGATADAS